MSWLSFGEARLESPAGPPPIDLTRARAETPGCEYVLHFNNAGAALMPALVVEAVEGHLRLESRIGGYEAAEETRDRLTATYQAVADLLMATPQEVALFESATRAWQMAFYSMPLGPGDRILTGRSEYASNYLAMLQVAQRRGVEIQVIPDDDQGQLDVGELERAIDDRVKLIAVTHVPSAGGQVNPAAAVGAVARRAGVPFLLDACQSAGQVPLDVNRLGCDLLVGTGRKYLRAPRGTGFLYVARDRIVSTEPAMIDLHGADWVAQDRYELRAGATRFETFEHSAATRIGLGVAVRYALEWGIDAIATRVAMLAAALRVQLREVSGITVLERGSLLCGIVTFTIAGVEAEEVRAQLRQQAINVWVSTAGTNRLDLEARGIEDMVRASVHYYNSEAEIERFVAAVGVLLRR